MLFSALLFMFSKPWKNDSVIHDSVGSFFQPLEAVRVFGVFRGENFPTLGMADRNVCPQFPESIASWCFAGTISNQGTCPVPLIGRTFIPQIQQPAH